MRYGLIAGIETDQQPDVGFKLVGRHSTSIFEKVTKLSLRLRHTLHGSFAEPLRRFGIIISFQPD